MPPRKGLGTRRKARTSAFKYNQAALLAILERPQAQRGMKVRARPSLLDIARENCRTQYPGDPVRNPASGTVNADTGVYRRSGFFSDTLELDIIGTDLQFNSRATTYREKSGAFAYGRALIEGTKPFIGPYKLLPPEFYDTFT